MDYQGILGNSKLADCEIGQISIDYDNERVELNYTTCDGKNEKIDFCKFVSFNLSHSEPWGKGKYVASSDVVIEENMINVFFELNSGDTILIVCNNS